MEGPEVEDIHGRIRDELASGKPRYEVLQGLVNEGHDRKATEVLIREEEERRYLKSAGRRQAMERHTPKGMPGVGQMVAGGLTFMVGVVVTVLTYANATPGGTYIVAWGAILFGGIRFVRGWAKASESGSFGKLRSGRDKTKRFDY